jgi:hypothetical protein
MKNKIFRIFTISIIGLFLISGRPTGIDKLWEEYNHYKNDDLPHKADKVLNDIITVAKENGYFDDLIKAYGEKSEIFSILYEYDEFFEKYANFLEHELASNKNDTLTSGFIHYYLANLYYDALNKFKPEIWDYGQTPNEMQFWPIKKYSSLITENIDYIIKNAAYFNKVKTSKLIKVIDYKRKPYLL